MTPRGCEPQTARGVPAWEEFTRLRAIAGRR